MRITYFALKPLRVGEDIREAGDLVPEASEWAFLSGYLSDGSIAPVLVATLPEEQQVMLLDWEESQREDATPKPEAPEAPEAPAASDTGKDKSKQHKTREAVA